MNKYIITCSSTADLSKEYLDSILEQLEFS